VGETFLNGKALSREGRVRWKRWSRKAE